VRRIVLGIAVAAAVAVVAPSLAAAWHAGEVVIGGYRLPRDHRFESPDAGGKYNVVSVNDVPALIQQGRFVFDRTAGVWVKNPNGTLNAAYLAHPGKPPAPAASAPSPPGTPSEERWDRISGTVLSVSDPTAIVRTEDGRNVTVDLSQAKPPTTEGLKPGDRVVVGGVIDQYDRVTARYIRDESQSGPPPADQGPWQRIHGHVQGVQGSRVRFRADDGRVLEVDASAVSAEIRRALTPNEGATLIGFAGKGRNQFRAEYIQQDSSGVTRR
jgi:hypothetical protein